jgi:hypothetical protein
VNRAGRLAEAVRYTPIVSQVDGRSQRIRRHWQAHEPAARFPHLKLDSQSSGQYWWVQTAQSGELPTFANPDEPLDMSAGHLTVTRRPQRGRCARRHSPVAEPEPLDDVGKLL